MKIKNKFEIEETLKIGNLPSINNSLSVLVENSGDVGKKTLGTISTKPENAYIPGLSVSFPSIFDLNTPSLDYNNTSLVVSLKNQQQGTALLAPVTMNGTPAFRRIVKSDLSDATVLFSDDERINNWNTAYSWGNHADLYIRKNAVNLTPASAWDTYEENRFVYSSSAANSPYTTYGVGINLYGSTSMRGQLFINTLNTGNQNLQFRAANVSGWSDVKTVWDDSNFSPTGVGGTAVLSNDWDSINASGFYRNSLNTATGLPASYIDMTLIHIKVDSTRATQICNRSGDTQMWYRTKNSTGWQPWVEIYNSGNLNTDSFVPYSGANSNVNLNGNGLSGVLDLSIAKPGLQYPNAIPSDTLAWSRLENQLIKLVAGNNQIAIIGNSANNSRRFGIQVGHTGASYAYIGGTLELNPFGGNVIVGALKGSGNRMVTVNSNGVLSSDILPTDYGNFRDYGLGLGQNTIGSWSTTDRYSGFISAVDHGGALGQTSGRLWGISVGYGSNAYVVQLALRNSRAGFRTRENGVDGNWLEFWHNGNLSDPATQSWVNTQNFHQTLTRSNTDIGRISISNGNFVDINSIRSLGKTDVNDELYTDTLNGFYAFTNSTGSTGFPTDLGGGIAFNRNSDKRGYFEFYKAQANSDNKLYFRVGNTSTTVFPYQIVASEEWVNAQGFLTSIPNNFVTTNNIASSTLATTVIDFDSMATAGATILYAGSASTNSPNLGSSTTGGALISMYHSSAGLYQIHLKRAIEDGLVYRGQSGIWYHAASRKWVEDKGFSTQTLVQGTNITISGNTISATNTTYSAMSVAEMTTGTATTLRTMRSDYLNTWINSKGYLTSVPTMTYNSEGTGKVWTNTIQTVEPATNPTSTANRSYGIQKNSSGQLVVNVPWTNTTYTNMSLAELTAGTVTTARTISSKTLNDWIASLGLNSGIFEYSTPSGGGQGIQTLGWTSFALGDKSIAIGSVTTAGGYADISIGTQVYSMGVGNYNAGFTIYDEGIYNTLSGAYLYNKADNATLKGTGLTNYQTGHVILGMYNNFTTDNIDISDPLGRPESIRLLTVGNGTSDLTRNDGFILYRDGATDHKGRAFYDDTLRDPSWFTKLNTHADVQFVQEYVAEHGGGGSGTADPIAIEGYQHSIVDYEEAVNGTIVNKISQTDKIGSGEILKGVIRNSGENLGTIVTFNNDIEAISVTTYLSNIGHSGEATTYSRMLGVVVKVNGSRCDVLLKGYYGSDFSAPWGTKERFVFLDRNGAVTFNKFQFSSQSDRMIGILMSPELMYFNPWIDPLN